MKIVKLSVNNIMRVKCAEITPDGNVIIVGGQNAQGKTTIMESIPMALGGKSAAPKKPLRTGAEHGEIVLELEEFVVERTYEADGSTKLIVKSKEGAHYPSPQTMLNEFYSALTFDPLAFKRASAKEQRTMLLQLLGLQDRLDDNRRHYGETYQLRRDANRALKDMNARLATMPEHEGVERVDTDKLWKNLATAEEEEKRILHENANIRHARDRVAQIESEIKELQGQLADYAVLGMKETVDIPDTVTEIREQIKSADDTNRLADQNAARKTERGHAEKVLETVHEYTGTLAGLDAKMQDMLSDVELPVEGLSVDNDGVVFNGEPFSQASSAEQLRVSCAMGFAMNPKLKVLIIRDGSLLDEKNLTTIGEMAAEHDAQVWIERVGEGEECSVIMEDGTVKS